MSKIKVETLETLDGTKSVSVSQLASGGVAVVDSLISTSATSALSANQGRVLNEKTDFNAATAKTTPADADKLPLADSAASFGLKHLTFANLKNVLLALFRGYFREKLTATRTYYVRADGSDSNDGLTNAAGGAFLTIQKAVDTAAGLDLGIYDVTIYVGAGTWTAATTLKTLVGAGQVLIRGINADTTSTVISTTTNDCFGGVFVGQYLFQYMKLQTATSGRELRAQGAGAVIRFNNIDFGACAQGHIAALAGGYIDGTGSTYTISGGAQSHIEANDTANVRISSASVTLTGTPAFSAAFIFAGRVSSALAVGTSFSGAATGKRYDVNSNAVITTLGGATFLPGNSAGTTANGGVYQ